VNKIMNQFMIVRIDGARFISPEATLRQRIKLSK